VFQWDPGCLLDIEAEGEVAGVEGGLGDRRGERQDSSQEEQEDGLEVELVRCG